MLKQSVSPWAGLPSFMAQMIAPRPTSGCLLRATKVTRCSIKLIYGNEFHVYWRIATCTGHLYGTTSRLSDPCFRVTGRVQRLVFRSSPGAADPAAGIDHRDRHPADRVGLQQGHTTDLRGVLWPSRRRWRAGVAC